MLGNLEFIPVHFEPSFKSLSRGSMLEIVTSGAMFDHMQAMLVRKSYRSWKKQCLVTLGGVFVPVPFEPSLGYVYDVHVPISQTRPLDSDF